MKRFKFTGDPACYLWDEKPIRGKLYEGGFIWEGDGRRAPEKLEDWAHLNPKDWQEVIEAPAPPHKDTDLGHFTGLILASMVGNSHNAYVKLDCDVMTKASILAAEELIKRLDEKTKKP